MNKTRQSMVEPRAVLAVVLLAAVAFCVIPGVSIAEEAAKTSKDAIIAKLKQRQSQFRTVQVTWSEIQTTNDGRTITVDDVKFVRDGEKMYYDSFTSGNVRPKGKVPRQRRIVSAFDGLESRDYMPPDETHGAGTIHSGKQFKDLENLYFLAVILAFDPLHPVLCDLQSPAVSVAPTEVIVDGHRCIELREPPGVKRGNYVTSYWLDCERDFIIVKCQDHVSGKLSSQVTVSYQTDPKYGWVPSGWKAISLALKSGDLREAAEARVSKCVINEPIPPETFDLRFPPHTLVRDLKNDRFWIELANGGRRIITKDEFARNASYEELLRTETGTAGKRPLGGFSRSSRSLVIVACTALGLILLGLLVWRQKKQRSA